LDWDRRGGNDMTRGVMIVGMRPSDPSRDRDFNEWYGTVHISEMCEIPGILSARRFVLSSEQMFPLDTAKYEYMSIYDFDTDDARRMVDELNARLANGTIHLLDVVELDPLPSIILYEEMP
jgi:hypothetical protein